MDSEEKLKTLGDLHPYNLVLAEMELSQAEKRYDSILDQKIKSKDKIRNGAIIINATSATAAFSALQNGDRALNILQVSNGQATKAFCFFVMGVALAGAAHWLSDAISPNWAVEQFKKMLSLRQRVAIFKLKNNAENNKLLNDNLQEAFKHKVTEFNYSKTETILINLSFSFWLTASVFLIYPTLKKDVFSMVFFDKSVKLQQALPPQPIRPNASPAPKGSK